MAEIFMGKYPENGSPYDVDDVYIFNQGFEPVDLCGQFERASRKAWNNALHSRYYCKA